MKRWKWKWKWKREGDGEKWYLAKKWRSGVGDMRLLLKRLHEEGYC
jgi:hypothetical protein